MKFQTIYRCPVCKEVIDIHKHPERIESDMAAVLLAGDGRRIHAKESPECTKHQDWIKGWVTDPTTEII